MAKLYRRIFYCCILLLVILVLNARTLLSSKKRTTGTDSYKTGLAPMRNETLKSEGLEGIVLNDKMASITNEKLKTGLGDKLVYDKRSRVSNDNDRLNTYELPRPDCSQKLLVYTCTPETVQCAGLADRQRGIISTFLLAILTNRTFVIKHTSPCILTDYLEPNIYDWSKCLPTVESSNDTYYINGMTHRSLFPGIMSTMNKGDIWDERIVMITTNAILNQQVKEHPNANETMPWIFCGDRTLTTNFIYHALFKNAKPFENLVTGVLTNLTTNGSKNLIGVHIRREFIIERELEYIYSVVLEYSRNSRNIIYMATDDASIREYAIINIPNCVTLNTSKVLHIQRNKADCDTFQFAMLEQQILSRSNTLIKTKSGFSATALMIRRQTIQGIFVESEQGYPTVRKRLFEYPMPGCPVLV